MSSIEEIKEKLDIVEVIGNYIKLQKAGQNYRGICPFHSEKKPSLFVSPSRQIWKCFGCGKSGDIFGFVKDIEGMEFKDALSLLAQKAGVELKKPSLESIKKETEKTRLYEVCEIAAQFFEKQFEGKRGKLAEEYLLKRGITKETIKKWRIGYAPDVWKSLADFLIKRGYTKDEIEKAGLEIRSEKGGFYDRFRGRIIFPIFDLNSRIIGFGGRIFGEKEDIAKYINSPATVLYDKSRTLYGLDKAKIETRKKDFFVLVEGYVDVILVSQSGFENVVAVSGTSLTEYQLKILKRYSENIYISFDMDVAGDSATKRGIDLAQAQGFNIKVIIMPQGKDPADITCEDSKKWEELVDNAKSILEFYFETTFSKFDSQKVEGKLKISKILLPIIKKIPNKIEQSYWLERLSEGIKTKTDDLKTELEKVEQESTYTSPVSEVKEEISPKTRKDLLEERIISLILKNNELFQTISKDMFLYFSEQSQEIFKFLKNSPNFDFRNPNLKKLSPGASDGLNYLCLETEAGYHPIKEEFDPKDLPDPNEEIKACLMETRNIEVKKELNQISDQIKIAEKDKETKKTESLIEKFNDLAQKLIRDR